MLTEHQKKFIKIINGFRHRHGVRNVFVDFMQLATCEISQNTRRSVGYEIDEYDEKSYMEILKKYKPEEIREQFADMFNCMVEGLETMEGDFLGPIFMDLNLGNSALGQFFTPYHVSLMMAEMSIDKDMIAQEIDRKGYLTMNDPCCGSGGMPLAYAQAFRMAGFNPETELFIVAQDLSSTAAQMTYLQLSLRGLVAQVLNMNSLIPDRVFWGRFTPVYFWMCWPWRLNRPKEQVALDIDSNIIECEAQGGRAASQNQLPLDCKNPLPLVARSSFITQK